MVRSRFLKYCCSWNTGSASDCEREYESLVIRDGEVVDEKDCEYIIEKLQVKRVRKKVLEELGPCDDTSCPNPRCKGPTTAPTCEDCHTKYKYVKGESRTTQVPSIGGRKQDVTIASSVNRHKSPKLNRLAGSGRTRMATTDESGSPCQVYNNEQGVIRDSQSRKIIGTYETHNNDNHIRRRNNAVRFPEHPQPHTSNEPQGILINKRISSGTQTFEMGMVAWKLQTDDKIDDGKNIFTKSPKTLGVPNLWSNPDEINDEISASGAVNTKPTEYINKNIAQTADSVDCQTDFINHIGPSSGDDEIAKFQTNQLGSTMNQLKFDTSNIDNSLLFTRGSKQRIWGTKKYSAPRKMVKNANQTKNSESALESKLPPKEKDPRSSEASPTCPDIAKKPICQVDGSHCPIESDKDSYKSIESSILHNILLNAMEYERKEGTAAAVNLYETIKLQNLPRVIDRTTAESSTINSTFSQATTEFSKSNSLKTDDIKYGQKSTTLPRESSREQPQRSTCSQMKRAQSEVLPKHNESQCTARCSKEQSTSYVPSISNTNMNYQKSKEIYSMLEAFKKGMDNLKKSGKDTSTSMADVKMNEMIQKFTNNGESCQISSEDFCQKIWQENMSEKVIRDIVYPTCELRTLAKNKLYLDCQTGSNSSMNAFDGVMSNVIMRQESPDNEHIKKVDTAIGSDNVMVLSKQKSQMTRKPDSDTVATQYSERRLFSDAICGTQADLGPKSIESVLERVVEPDTGDEDDYELHLDLEKNKTYIYQKKRSAAKTPEAAQRLMPAPMSKKSDHKPNSKLKRPSSPIHSIKSSSSDKGSLEKRIFLRKESYVNDSLKRQSDIDRKRSSMNTESSSSIRSYSGDLGKRKIRTIDADTAVGKTSGDSKTKTTAYSDFVYKEKTVKCPSLDAKCGEQPSSVMNYSKIEVNQGSRISIPRISTKLPKPFPRRPRSSPSRNSTASEEKKANKVTKIDKNGKEATKVNVKNVGGEHSGISSELDAAKNTKTDSETGDGSNQGAEGSSLKWVITIKHPEAKQLKNSETSSDKDEEPCRLEKNNDVCGT